MERRISCCALVVVILSLMAPRCAAKDGVAQILKQQERYTVSLELEFSRKSPNALDRVMTFLDMGPSGYATGFMIGEGLVVTSYHVVSGELGEYKKMALGFAGTDEIAVKIFVKGCRAKVITVDKDADLALLEMCGSQKKSILPTFQATPDKDEKLLLIARPHGDSILRRGTLAGSYKLNGLEYWSAKLNARDGFSGSPVYNQQAELVGVMSGYDPTRKLALISPVSRVQKLLENYAPPVRK
ncbi:MAG: serine protease [Acidobacteriota bacterium]|nr:serine protease [Acidobacteriota bacterium]